MDNLLPRLPFASWIDDGVDWLVSNFGSVFDGIANFLKGVVEGAVDGMGLIGAFHFTSRSIRVGRMVHFDKADCDLHIGRFVVH